MEMLVEIAAIMMRTKRMVGDFLSHRSPEQRSSSTSIFRQESAALRASRGGP
jgi:hypothetical protein